MNWDTAFHAGELLVLLLGIALPSWKNHTYLRAVLRNYPPHLHNNGDILYPKGFDPPQIVKRHG